MEEKILIKELYDDDDDILLSINEKLKRIILNAIKNKKKTIISFEMVSLTKFFLKDFKSFVNDNPNIYEYIVFQKVNKFYKKNIFLKG